MIALVQRVTRAEVTVAGRPVGAIGRGLLVFVCAEPDDDEALADRLVAKLLKLRIFADDAGKMNRSVTDVAGALLLVPQFTLAADTRSGTRLKLGSSGMPSSDRASRPNRRRRTSCNMAKSFAPCTVLIRKWR